MGTQQELTTEQATVLIIFQAFQKLADEVEDNETPVKELIGQFFDDINMGITDLEEIVYILQYYGYISFDCTLTTDGKQYIALLSDYNEQRHKFPNLAVNVKFALLDSIEFKLMEISGLSEIVNIVGDIGKWIKENISKLNKK